MLSYLGRPGGIRSGSFQTNNHLNQNMRSRGTIAELSPSDLNRSELVSLLANEQGGFGLKIRMW